MSPSQTPVPTDMSEEERDDPSIAASQRTDWLLGVAEGIKLELWGLVLTVLTIVAFYATFIAIISSGGQIDPTQSDLTFPFLLGLVAGQSLAFLGRLKCPTLPIGTNNALYTCWGAMILGLGLMWLNVFRSIPVIIQLYGCLFLLAGQLAFWLLLADVCRLLGTPSHERQFKRLVWMGVTAIICMLVPQVLRSFSQALVLQDGFHWFSLICGISMVILVGVSLVAYVYVLFQLRKHLLRAIEF